MKRIISTWTNETACGSGFNPIILRYADPDDLPDIEKFFMSGVFGYYDQGKQYIISIGCPTTKNWENLFNYDRSVIVHEMNQRGIIGIELYLYFMPKNSSIIEFLKWFKSTGFITQICISYQYLQFYQTIINLCDYVVWHPSENINTIKGKRIIIGVKLEVDKLTNIKKLLFAMELCIQFNNAGICIDGLPDQRLCNIYIPILKEKMGKYFAINDCTDTACGTGAFLYPIPVNECYDRAKCVPTRYGIIYGATDDYCKNRKYIPGLCETAKPLFYKGPSLSSYIYNQN